MTGMQISIARIMRERNLTQVDIARPANISQQTMNSYLRGTDRHEPSLTKAIRIADALDISLDELVGRRREA